MVIWLSRFWRVMPNWAQSNSMAGSIDPMKAPVLPIRSAQSASRRLYAARAELFADHYEPSGVEEVRSVRKHDGLFELDVFGVELLQAGGSRFQLLVIERSQGP